MNNGRANVANLYQLYSNREVQDFIYSNVQVSSHRTCPVKNPISAQNDSTAHKGLVHKDTINHSYCMYSNSCD